MIKETAYRIAVIILLTAINSCYYERESNDELEICFVKNNNIWTMNIDGSNQNQITDGPDDFTPSWSPDGKRILFGRFESSAVRIYLIDSDGKNLKQITYNVAPVACRYPTWSADGENIYYYEENGSHSIVSAKPDGTIIRKYSITNQASSLSASPDGRYVYYIKDDNSYRLDLTTGDEINFTDIKLYHCSVSPDGNNVAFSLDAHNIYIYNITTNTADFLVSAAVYPCWAPDSKSIIYINLGASHNISRINIDRTNQTPLSSGDNCNTPCFKWKPI